MDQAADGLLALSSIAAATAEGTDALDDDRSSSLSDLEDAPEDIDQDDELDAEPAVEQPTIDGDSEAETEKLDSSPDKIKRGAFQISPSKLAQTANADERPEIEALTDSDVSSPMTPVEDSPLEELSEAEDLLEQDALQLLSQVATNKRKRLSDVMDMDGDRPRKRRAESVDSDDDKSDADSDLPDVASREPTVEPDEQEVEAGDEAGEQPVDEDMADLSDTHKPRKATRSSKRGKDMLVQDPEDDEAAALAGMDASDDEAEADDVDAAAKSEEEQAKRALAMESLLALERHFALLRDKLYDEKIAQLNHELAQLAEPEPSHPQLLRQVDCVHKYRDDKQEVEQRLLVYKVGALKRKSVAERAQIHSSYFQRIRDLREYHMERMSERFYRIQRERFKSTRVTPIYTIPFPQTKLLQVTQQIAYNKEVSILSGIEKYVGFPAAPEFAALSQHDLDSDMQKMGISPIAPPSTRPFQPRQSNSSLAPISAPAAEEQFLEQTPWANPNHPIHRLNRQTQPSSPTHEDRALSTPAHQQKQSDIHRPLGSASTIVENPSSALNTPHDPSQQAKHARSEPQTNGLSTTNRPASASASPTDTRRVLAHLSQTSAANNTTHSASHHLDALPASSPLQARAALLAEQTDRDRASNKSPFRHAQPPSIGVGGSRFGFS